MCFLGSKYANNEFAAGAGPHWGAYSAPLDPLAGKGGGAPLDGPHPKGETPGKEMGGGQILRLKCDDALYKYTDLLTYISSTIGCANYFPDWSLTFKVHEI